MAIVCAECDAQMPDESSFCPQCGRPVAQKRVEAASTRGTPDNALGALAYVTFIPAIVFLFVEPFNKSRFLRFHSFQCVFLSIMLGIIGLTLRIALLVLSMVPIVGRLVSVLLLAIVLLGCFILWVVLLIKAFQGEMFKLPIIGDWAEAQAEQIG
jgi:uncharacterized membrane protein